MVSDPPRFRANVQPFCSKTQRASARTALKLKIEQKVDFKETSKVQDKLLLNKQRYKSYRMFWDRCGSVSASEDFDDLMEQQGRRHCTTMEDKVAVEDNAVLRQVRGSREETITGDDDLVPALGRPEMATTSTRGHGRRG